jgi:hypothetical protein
MVMAARVPACRHTPTERQAANPAGRCVTDRESYITTAWFRGMGSASRRVMRAGGNIVRVVLCLWWIAAFSAPASANQDSEVLPSRMIGTGDLVLLIPDPAADIQRLLEAQRWLAQYAEWKEWNATWRNRREPGWLGARDRRQRPDPPTWLPDECPNVLPGASILANACRSLAEWTDDVATAQLRQEMMSERVQHEAPRNSSWWEHLHVDLLWPVTQWRTDVYGVVGTHATIDVAGRFEIFVAPGVILLNVSTGPDTREWKLATDWGMAFRCFDFTMPGTNRRASMHVNVAKALMLSNTAGLMPRTVNLAGFSVTMKKAGH